MKTIGILGGMGPRVTVVFEQMLLDRFEGSDQEVSTIVTINDGSIPDRSAFLLGRGVDPVPKLQKNIQLLEKMGAEIIALPCNSASMSPIFGRLESTALLINLPKLVIEELRRTNIQRVCLLATEGTTNTNTYQTLCEQQGIECVVASSVVRREITSIIELVKRGEINEAKRQSKIAARSLENLNCEAIILGCTELPLVKDQLVPNASITIDTLGLLADACVQLSKGEKYAKRPIYA